MNADDNPENESEPEETPEPRPEIVRQRMHPPSVDFPMGHEWFGMLDANHNVIRPESMQQWEKWMFNDRLKIGVGRIGYETINGWKISTIFLGINHGFGGPQRWFETMIFVDDNRPATIEVDERLSNWRENQQLRYETWQEAERGHAMFCEIIRTGSF
jgi:hypothetical protein